MDLKTCSRCHTPKPRSEFFPLYGKQLAAAGPAHDGLKAWCKKCHGRVNNEYKQNNPEARKRYIVARRVQSLRSKFGMTPEQYFVMLEAQGGGCAICGAMEGRRLKKLSKTPFHFIVDHDHETGANRGLLCDSCNRGIGLLKDSPSVLQAARDYLILHGKVADD